jgi:hypothetical protein
VHPTPRAKSRSAANEPARRSLFFDDDIAITTPRVRPLASELFPSQLLPSPTIRLRRESSCKKL